MRAREIEGALDVGILGMMETCNGDPARRAGNEYLFQMLAETNLSTFEELGVKKIVSSCPHCFHTLGKEYKAFGGEDIEVLHHSQLISTLQRDGRLPAPKHDGEVTYHDPCYLGRGNGEYEAPRAALQALDADLVEMRRCKSKGLCCGAGGAQMFKDAEKGNREVNHERTDDVLETGAKVIATGCPFCNTMMTDGVKNAEKEGEIDVKDIAELIAEAADLL